MNRHHSNGDWVEDAFIGAEVFRHLFSFKGLLLIAIVVLVIATWSPRSSPEQLNGEITDQDTHLPVDSTLVTLQDTLGNTIEAVYTDSSGVFTFQVREGSAYRLQIEKKGYHSRVINDTRDMNGSTSVLLRIALRQDVRQND